MKEVQHKCVDKSLQKAVSVKLDDKCHLCLRRIKADHMVISVFRFRHCVVSQEQKKEGLDLWLTHCLSRGTQLQKHKPILKFSCWTYQSKDRFPQQGFWQSEILKNNTYFWFNIFTLPLPLIYIHSHHLSITVVLELTYLYCIALCLGTEFVLLNWNIKIFLSYTVIALFLWKRFLGNCWFTLSLISN